MSRNVDAVFQVKKEDGILLKDKIIKGTFTSQNENLGSVAMQFTTFGRINSDKLLFRLREENAKKWYYENSYSSSLIADNTFFPFGFVPISDSKDKTYEFEIQSLSGTKDNSVGIKEENYMLITKYQYDKTYLFRHPLFFTKYIIEKLVATFIFYNLLLYLALVYLVMGIFKLLQKRIYVLKQSLAPFQDLNKKHSIVLIGFIIILGLSIRFYFAFGPYNFDINSFMSYVPAFEQRKNIYLATPFYNWSPAFYFVSGGIGFLTKSIQILPLHFTFRAFTSLIDLATLFVLLGIARKKGMSELKIAILFFLNPVTIVTSGRHGHFDNFSLFFILLALFLYYKWGQKLSRSKTLILWSLVTFGLAVKHIIMFQVLTFLVRIAKKRTYAFIFFSGSVVFLLLTFLPYFFEAREEIMKQVIGYSGLGGMYGITYFIRNWCASCQNMLVVSQAYRTVFMLAAFGFCFFLRKGDPARLLLLSVLFFLSFTSGIGAQYFVLPIALGALFPTKWFYLYSTMTTLFYLGSIDEFGIPVFQIFSFNTVWIFVLMWFIAEIFQVFPQLRKYFQM